MPSSISDYKTAMTALFLVMMVAIAIIFAIFNIFIFNLLKPLRRTMDELKAASKAKSDFLAKMSHEIRTPMNAITGMAELALREDIPNSAREHVITIKQAGANLLSIINDILDFSKIESGKLEITPVNYQFSSLIHDVVSIIKMRVVDSVLRFVVNIDCNIPHLLYGDETRVRQILLNILSNAVKYTKKGFISLSVNGEITDDTILLTIDVTDSGKGIKQEDIGKLFGEFVQVDLASNKGIEGTGLGLVITKNLVKAMDGDISVQSEYRKGSTFTITLPQKIKSPEPLATVENSWKKSVLVYEEREIYADSIVCTVDNLGVNCKRVENDEELREKLKDKNYTFVFISYTLLENVKKIMQEVKSKSKIAVLTEFGDTVADTSLNILAMPVHSISVANLLNGISDTFSYSANENAVTRFIAPSAKILIVDDISTNLKVAEGLMLPYKMQIDSCLSGYEAIEAVKGKGYDLVFMDQMMPGMDGIEATTRIRELGNEIPHCHNITIIALTANAVSGTREMFLANRFDDFLSKPIDTVKLNDILAKWLPKEKQEKLKEGITESMETVEQASADIKISGIDVKKGIAMTGGKLEFYLQTLAIFHKEGIQKINEIKKCLETDDYDLYTIYVHALKSSLASIGSSELSETARLLETAGKQSDFDFIKSNNVQFLTDFNSILSDIGKILASKDEKQEIPMDFEVLKCELNRLKEALETLDSAAIDEVVDNLQKFTKTSEIGAKVENILQSILIGEYDEAIAIIDSMVA
jgi:signal transduction histidine kinase/CheY-like chemotaxis protein